MKWDETGISVCEFIYLRFGSKFSELIFLEGSFYRAAVPQDIEDGSPSPSGWGLPVASLSPKYCDPLSTFFVNHSIVFGTFFFQGIHSDFSTCEQISPSAVIGQAIHMPLPDAQELA
jgi:hypothetical protein